MPGIQNWSVPLASRHRRSYPIGVDWGTECRKTQGVVDTRYDQVRASVLGDIIVAADAQRNNLNRDSTTCKTLSYKGRCVDGIDGQINGSITVR
jgi:hypothetical protein